MINFIIFACFIAGKIAGNKLNQAINLIINKTKSNHV